MAAETILPRDFPSEALYEVVDGVVVDSSPAGVWSTVTANRVATGLQQGVSRSNTGWALPYALYVLDAERDLRRRPAVSFVRKERGPIPLEGDWDIAPDLAVEVTDEKTRCSDMLSRVHEYFSCGVGAVWVLSRKVGTAYVYQSPVRVEILTSEDSLDAGAFVPGLTIPLNAVFRPQLDLGSVLGC